jgi:exopolyphosphatase/guanosine-5'-triphosphate,3'-diphosphate pyrophosphatase
VEGDAITLCDFGVREGLVIDYLLAHATEVRAIGDVEDLRLRSVLQLLQKFQPEERQIRHARHVAQLSLVLFDGLRRAHRLGDDAKEILHYAALLHDVGATIGYDGHGQHSYYIIRNGNLRGLSADEVERIAEVARYHGKARPRKRDQAFRALDRERRREVRWLAAILRIAEGLDRSHYQLVRELAVRRSGRRVTLGLTTRPGARLEVWAARDRVDLLEKLLGAPVRVTARVAARRGPSRRQSGARAKVIPIRSRPGLRATRAG